MSTTDHIAPTGNVAAMMEITPSPDIELTDEQTVEVRRRAKRLGLSTEAYVEIMLKRRMTEAEERFIAAAQELIEQHRETFIAYDAKYAAKKQEYRAQEQAAAAREQALIERRAAASE